MLHIALLILKILGILLLVLLGLLAAVLLLVLFVPVRYRLNADFHGKPVAKLEVGWLSGALRASLSYDEAAVLRIQALWHCFVRKQLWPSEEPEPETADDISDGEPVSEVFFLDSGDAPEEVLPGEDKDIEDGLEEGPAGEESGEHSAGEPAEMAGNDFEEGMDMPLEEILEPEETGDEPEETSFKPSITERIVRIFHAVIDFLKKGKENVTGIFCRTKKKAAEAGQRIDRVLAFLKDEGNQRAMVFLLSRAGKLIRHVLPGKIRGHIRYGFDDPYQTGQVLTFISPFYGLYAKTLAIEPVFDEKVIEGEIFVRGRVRAAAFVGAGLRILLNKDSRRFLKKLIRLFR